MYHWAGGGSIWKLTSDGIQLGQKPYIGYTYVALTAPKYWFTSFTGETSGSINTVSTLGLPSGVKAVHVSAFYHITGYSSGWNDHANSMWGPVVPSSSTSWSFTTSNNQTWGSFMFEHDGDASGSPHFYGVWQNGQIGVNNNGLIYYRLGQGISGGTHYNHVWVWGYWI
jgi:hypothetical protein